MPTLSELSTRLFRDVQENYANTVRELDAVEQSRRQALRALDGAGAPLDSWQAALDDAEDVLAASLGKIELDFGSAERTAAERRRAALEQADTRFRQADARAAAARTASEDQAVQDYEADLARIDAGSGDPAQKVLARGDAHRRFRQKLDAARAVFLQALETSRNTHQDDRRTADRQEMSDLGAARDHARMARERAQQIYARAGKAADTRLRAALERVPGAGDVQARFDARRQQIKRESREREAALFEAYRAARTRL